MTKLKKRSIFTCLAWSFAGLGLVVLLGLFVAVGIRILQKRDPNNACEDFYVHTCSKPLSSASNTSDHKKGRDLNDMIEKNINKLQSSENEMTKMIDACIDTEEIESVGLEPLQTLLAQLSAMGPGRDHERMKGVMAVMGLVTKRLSSNGLFNVFVVPNYFDSMENVIFLSTNTEFLASPIPNPFSPIRKLEKKYFDEIKRIVFEIILRTSGFSREKIARDMVRFWFRVNEIQISPVTDETDLTTIEKLHELTHLDWLEFFQSSFGPETVDSETLVIVHEKKKIVRLAQLMLDACGGPSTVRNFVVFKGIQPLLWHTTSEMQKHSIELEKMTTFQSVLSPWLLTRTQMCYKTAIEQLPYHTTRELYGGLYTEDDLNALDDMFGTIKSAFHHRISENRWLSETSKQKILKKLDAMTLDLPYPEIVANSTLLAEVYDRLCLNNSRHFANVLTTTTARKNLMFGKLNRDPKSDKIWILPPASISAWNILYENKIQIPIGLLLYKSYNSKSSLIEQYSDIGFVMAHEIAHGFDSHGIKFNENGRMDDSLLDEASKTVFNDKLQFLVRQYNKFCLQSHICVDGKKTLNENIADVIGVKMSYLGFMKALESQEKKSKKSNENFIPFPSPDVQFFYYYAKKFCIEDDFDFIKWIIKFSRHSPNHQRVIGPLSNMNEFSHLFQCQWIDSMNPVTKFDLW